MNDDAPPGLNLSDAAKPLIWRVFGSAADPRNEKSAYELVVPILSKRLRDATAAPAIAEVRSWFEQGADRPWIKPDLLEPIAGLIVEGLETDFSALAVWSVSAIDADVVGPLLRSWPETRIDAFTDAAIGALAVFRDRGDILDPTRVGGLSDLNRRRAKISRAGYERNCPLATFVHLERHGWELVHNALHPAVRNLIDILVDLLIETRPTRLASFLAQLEHPILHARASDRYRFSALEANGEFPPLQWITPTADDALIALSTLQTLNAVNSLAQDRERQEHRGAVEKKSQHQPIPDHEHSKCERESLISMLVERTANLPAERFIRWAADVLSHGPQILHEATDGSFPADVQFLEDQCAIQVAHILSANEPSTLLDTFRTRLTSDPRANSFRHVADFAWALRNCPDRRAVAVAGVALDDYRKFADKELADGRFYFNWAHWTDRQVVCSLGRALALSVDTFEPAVWVASECQRLPLSVWDAEDSMETFFAADRIAQFTFLIALHALQPAAELGRMPVPESVREVSEKIWAHCRLADRVGCLRADIVAAAEMAARTAIRLANTDDTWILRQAVAGPGPRALLALAQERGLDTESGATRSAGDNAFAAEFATACATQFKQRPVPALDALVYWGRLWLLLHAAEPAERTAAAIIGAGNPHGPFNRTTDILVLKLLALAESQLPVTPEVQREINARYDALWLSHTPTDENADREQVDAYRRRAVAPKN